MPSILFVNRVFPPDPGATGRCLADLAHACAAAGWRVTVLTDGGPPAGAAPPESGSGGVTVAWTGRSLDGRESRLAGYLGALRRLACRGLALPRHDVVVTLSDPPLLALAGPMLAARHSAALLHWSHDVYPALLPRLGTAVPPGMLGFVSRRMAAALARHDPVVAIGRCMAARLTAEGVPAARVHVVPNWPDPAIRPVPHAENRWRAELGLGPGGQFVVGYCGNFGLAHPLAGVLAAAERLQRADAPVLFLMVGDGRGHAAVLEGAAARGLTNMRFLPRQPAACLAEVMSAADLHLAVMRRDAEGLLVPSKAMGGLAAGRPCLFLGPAGSEAARLLLDHGCGAVLDPDDGTAIAATVEAYRRDPARTAAEGARAAAAAAGWQVADAGQRFRSLLAGLVEARTAAGGTCLPACRVQPHG